MGAIRGTLKHQLGIDEAKARLSKFVSSLVREYPDQVHRLDSRWQGDSLQVSFSAYGFQYHWDVSVGENAVELLGEFPADANPYRGKIEKTVVGKIEDLLFAPAFRRRAA